MSTPSVPSVTNPDTLPCLLSALEESQTVIRAYDTKSEVLGVLLAICVGVLNFNYIGASHSNLLLNILMAASTFMGFTAIFLAGMVLYPSKNPSEYVTNGSVTPTGTYYVPLIKPKKTFDLTKYCTDALATNWIEEVSFEILKTSGIRERKHWFFTCAMRAAGITLLLIFITLLTSILSPEPAKNDTTSRSSAEKVLR